MFYLKKIIKFLFMPPFKLYLIFSTKNLKLGSNVTISFDSKLNHNNFINDGCRIIKSSLGAYSYVSPYSILVETEVGKYCSIGPGCKIGLGIHPLNYVSTSPYFYNENLFKSRNSSDFDKTIIGSDVWIGANAMILGGIRVGHGAVIGAGAVVTKDVPDYAIVVGIPAKVIKYRFDDDVKKSILSTKWWEYDHKNLMKLKNAFNDPKNFSGGFE